jgi:hypothetical protein
MLVCLGRHALLNNAKVAAITNRQAIMYELACMQLTPILMTSMTFGTVVC